MDIEPKPKFINTTINSESGKFLKIGNQKASITKNTPTNYLRGYFQVQKDEQINRT